MRRRFESRKILIFIIFISLNESFQSDVLISVKSVCVHQVKFEQESSLRQALDWVDLSTENEVINILVPPSSLSAVADILFLRGFKLLVHDMNHLDGPQLIWSKRLKAVNTHDLPQATPAVSRISAGALVLSPDEKSVLLIAVTARGMQKLFHVYTSVHQHETAVVAAQRRVTETIGVQIDEAFSPRFVSGFHSPDSHQLGFADVHLCFVFRAKSNQFRVGNEVFFTTQIHQLNQNLLPTNNPSSFSSFCQSLIRYLDWIESGRSDLGASQPAEHACAGRQLANQ